MNIVKLPGCLILFGSVRVCLLERGAYLTSVANITLIDKMNKHKKITKQSKKKQNKKKESVQKEQILQFLC